MAIKEQSQRQLRVGQEIKRIIAAEINQGRVRNLEGISTLVTVMEAQVSPDLKYADVYFITSNPETDKEVLEGLQLAANQNGAALCSGNPFQDRRQLCRSRQNRKTASRSESYPGFERKLIRFPAKSGIFFTFCGKLSAGSQGETSDETPQRRPRQRLACYR